MDEYYEVVRTLPEPLRSELSALNPQAAPHIQEIRLRAEQPVRFTVRGRLAPAVKFLPSMNVGRRVEAALLHSCFLSLCRNSAYAYEDELRQGFLTLPNGSRVGVAGIRGPAGFTSVTSLNLRVARWITCGLPDRVTELLDAMRGGVLVAGAPGSGKTTFLRSMAEYLAARERILCVVDERAELMLRGHPLCCDVYSRYGKAEAICMALRCMNPQVILCDELGTEADARALEAGIASGAVFLASIHCDAPEQLTRKPFLSRLLQTGAFSTAVFLSGREAPGRVSDVIPL